MKAVWNVALLFGLAICPTGIQTESMKEQHSAGIVVYTDVNGTREYLLMHYAAGHWDFVKGKLESGETKLQAAIRELEEESGITTIELHDGFEESFAYVFDFKGEPTRKTVNFFVGKTTEQEVTLSNEHRGYRWLSYDQAYKNLTYQNAKNVLEKAEQFLG